jgi:hypothetical protein
VEKKSIERERILRHPLIVRTLRRVMVLLLALAWVPLMSHCKLESVPGLEFLACLAEGDSHDEQSSDCEDTECCSAEKSLYKTEKSHLVLSPPDLLPLSSAPVLDLANALPDEASVGMLTAAPPELTKAWNFISRTASPPRAPSFAS